MYSKTMIIGHLGADPEMRYLADGKPVTNFSVATSQTWKDQAGQPQEKTTWFRVAAWGKLGEICNEYLRKGAQVYVEGTVSAHAWVGKDGAPACGLELKADEVRFLGKKEGGATAPPTDKASPKPPDNEPF